LHHDFDGDRLRTAIGVNWLAGFEFEIKMIAHISS